MNPIAHDRLTELHAMRDAFDAGFAEAPSLQTGARINFLAIRLAGDAFAIRTTDIAELYADRRIMPMPSPVPSLLGLAAFRGVIAPVYDLAALIGLAGKVAPRWLVLIKSADPVALAFERFDAHFSAGAEQLLATQQTASTGPIQSQSWAAVRSGDDVLPIIPVQALLDQLHHTPPQ